MPPAGDGVDDALAVDPDGQRRERSLELAALREELRAAREAAERVEAGLAQLESREREAGAESERRLDELVADGLRVRREVEDLSERVETAAISGGGSSTTAYDSRKWASRPPE